MDTKTLYIIVGIVVAVLLTCYIIALVKSKKGELVFTYNGWDMALLIACPVLFVIGMFVEDQHPHSTALYVLWGVSAACLIGTSIFSVVYNWGSIWKVLCSVFAKLFAVLLTYFVIMILIMIVVFYIISLFFNRNERDEYIILKYDRWLKAYVGYRYS